MTQPSTLPSQSPSQASFQELTSVLFGPSTAMTRLWTQIRHLAPHVRRLLLTGSAHCGQEAVARLLLELSPERDRPFLALSARDLDAHLLRGGSQTIPQDAFLYLPDLCALSPEAQTELLRLLRQRRNNAFTVVAASVADLRSLVSMGRFDAELAETLGAVRIALPSLAQRAEDLPMLLDHLLTAECARHNHPVPHLSEGFLQAAMQHPWEGNLAELSVLLSALASDQTQEEVTAADFTRHRTKHVDLPAYPKNVTPVRMIPLEAVANEHIYAVLRACRGNKLRAAEVLGISRSTLYRMLDAAAVEGSQLSLAS